MALWDGRFEGGPAEAMQRFSESLSTDLLMWREDVAGSRAHATMLHEVGILTREELTTILDGLDRVSAELEGGWTPGIDQEDVHMAVEGRLHALVGPVAGKLHTARSRNDQVATDLRLWMRNQIDQLDTAIAELIGVLVDRAETDGKVVVPGYTHLQRGQPIWLAHQLLAHAWSLSRDRERLADTRKRVNRSPLGAAAMAGTPHPIDRARSAALLDFERPMPNAMDAVSARDHVLELASTCAIVSTHLSRMAEELVVWSTREFGWVRLSDAWSTGSSIMPQKRNPDAAELVRGRTGRATGALVSLLTLVKALPLAYNRDLQEDRVALFPAVQSVLDCTRVLSGCYGSLEVKGGPDLTGDFALTTELADFLSGTGVPFREAHHVAGRLVKLCEDRGHGLDRLTLSDLQDAHPAFTAEVLGWLDPVQAIERRTSLGGTAWSQVVQQVAALRRTL